MAHLVTAKMTPDALRLVRLIAAATGEKQYEVLLRLLAAEAKRRKILEVVDNGEVAGT